MLFKNRNFIISSALIVGSFFVVDHAYAGYCEDTAMNMSRNFKTAKKMIKGLKAYKPSTSALAIVIQKASLRLEEMRQETKETWKLAPQTENAAKKSTCEKNLRAFKAHFFTILAYKKQFKK